MSEPFLRAVLRDDFDIEVTTSTPVEAGEDVAATVHQAIDAVGQRWAVWSSRSPMVAGPLAAAHLAAAGVRGVLSPVASRTGAPYTRIEGLTVSVAPWVRGTSGAQGMTQRAWRSYGELLAAVHAASVPDRLRLALPQEDHSAPLADLLDVVDSRVRAEVGHGLGVSDDAIGAQLTECWSAAAEGIREVTRQCRLLADRLRSQPSVDVLCHGDAHAHNVVIRDDQVTLLDWESAVLAPRERDLMFVLGGRIVPSAPVTADDAAAFFEGY